jgi:hypothetical protein
VFSLYIFTLLIFRKLNKPQLTKIKQYNFIGIHAIDFRLYLDMLMSFFKWKESSIFRYFKVFQVSPMFTYGLSDLLLLAVSSLVVFVLLEYILKVHVLISSEHKLCQIWNTCIMPYWVLLIISKNLQLECILHYITYGGQWLFILIYCARRTSDGKSSPWPSFGIWAPFSFFPEMNVHFLYWLKGNS